MRCSGVLGLVAVLVAFGLVDLRSLAVSPDLDESPLSSYESTLARIATDIEQLKTEYPQLVDFSTGVHFSRDRLVISYGYKTHQAPHRGGWTSGVPSPDEDGVWFYIDFHRPDSSAEIHTQPMVPRYRFRDEEVMFLILEGEKTRSLRAAIVTILFRHGITALNGGANGNLAA